MFGFIKKLFGTKPVETVVEVPYKVEVATPAVTKVADQATQAVVESIAKSPAKKPQAKKPAGNKPRGPRKPKAKPAVTK